MSPIAIGVLALGMSIDALVASISRGARNPSRRPDIGMALRTGLVFGVIEMLTPLVGWAAGMAAASFVESVDHWIAFALLGAVGGHMLLAAFAHGEASEESPARAGLMGLVLTALGTSVDAMAVGVSLAFLDVDIWVIALAIGLTTAAMATTGMLAGRVLGARFGRWAEGAGGLALMALGTGILLEHLGLWT